MFAGTAKCYFKKAMAARPMFKDFAERELDFEVPNAPPPDSFVGRLSRERPGFGGIV